MNAPTAHGPTTTTPFGDHMDNPQAFSIDISQTDIDDLYRRLDDTRWPDMLPGVASTSGAPLHRVQELATYWRNNFDWRQAEMRLNTYPQFRTEIDGTTIHYVTVRSPRNDAKPLLLVHGWPGSYLEYLDTVGPLTDPEAHGGSASDPAFHVVLPSLPGYTFSGPVAETVGTLNGLLERCRR